MESEEKISERQRIIFCVAIYTGMRAGELWGLRWADVHMNGSRPRVVVRYSYAGPTKTGQVREVPLLPPAQKALLAWKKRSPGIRTALVFPSPRTGLHHDRGYDAGWIKAKQKAGIVRPVRFHDLRHTCASHLVQGTWGPPLRLEEVRQWLGHSSISVTERYAHLSPESIHRAAQTLSEWWK